MVPSPRRHLARAAVTAASGLLLLGATGTAATATPTATPTANPTATPTATPTASGTPSLLRPTGPHAVGATSLYLKDTSRPDPWVPTIDARELMVTVWYPSDARHGKRMPYMTPEESRLFLAGKHLTTVPPDILSTVRTNAYLDARPAGRAHSLPLVVLSPGYTEPRTTLTGLAEDLASHGYVVVGIDHTYETYAVTFPGGRIAPCAACDLTEDDAFFGRLYQSRAADVSFVLDRLTGPHPAWKGGRLIDASRIGMSGHSAGGTASITTMLRDPRVDAGIDMDGTTRDAVPPTGLDRPFMFFGTQAVHSPGGDPTWDDDWKLLTGWKRWLVVAGTVHASFTDLTLLGDQVGVASGATTSGVESMRITRRYNLALFDRTLRGHPEPLLDHPSSRYPEVVIAAR